MTVLADHDYHTCMHTALLRLKLRDHCAWQWLSSHHEVYARWSTSDVSNLVHDSFGRAQVAIWGDAINKLDYVLENKII